MKNLYILLLLTFGFGQDYSLSFDGDDDYIHLGDGENLFNINNSLTINAWIYPENNGEYEIFDGSSSRSSAPTNNAGYAIRIQPDGKLYGAIGNHNNETETEINSNSIIKYSLCDYKSNNVILLFLWCKTNSNFYKK